MEHTYSTRDIYLASSLITYGFTTYSMKKQGKDFYFFFYDDPLDIAKVVDAFWQSKLSLPALSLYNNFKMLKNRIYEGI